MRETKTDGTFQVFFPMFSLCSLSCSQAHPCHKATLLLGNRSTWTSRKKPSHLIGQENEEKRSLWLNNRVTTVSVPFLLSLPPPSLRFSLSPLLCAESSPSHKERQDCMGRRIKHMCTHPLITELDQERKTKETQKKDENELYPDVNRIENLVT